MEVFEACLGACRHLEARNVKSTLHLELACSTGSILFVRQELARQHHVHAVALGGGRGNAQGEPIALKDAEQHIFGICLLNDWSARDIQFWEMAPLGPFLGKNFCTTISPWIVTMEALAPYRQAFTRPASDPQPLAYLDDASNKAQGAIDISLEVLLESDKLRAEGKPPARLSGTSFKHQYWTVAQMVTHHTMGGCNLKSGDLFGSGTISGPGEGQAGAMIELAYGGTKPVPLGNGETRGFLHDGDAVILRGWCEKPGHARIGFVESKGTVFPRLVVECGARLGPCSYCSVKKWRSDAHAVERVREDI